MTEPRNVLRCAIYIRVSTAMQRMDGWSLDAQRASLTKFAQARGWKVVEVYADEGKSARKRLKDRKEIHRLLEDVKNGKIDVILFKELDRWFRNVSDFYKVQEVLDAYGVTWVSERQPNLNMNTKEGRLNINILLSVGQNETDSTSDRIKYTNKFMREQKRWTSSKRTLPRGYILDDDQHVIIDPEWEDFIRAGIEKIMRYGSVRRAVIECNEEFDKVVYYGNFMAAMRNPLLCGTYVGDTWNIPDFVEKPYLTREEFDALQAQIQRRVRAPQKQYYIFSGLLKCEACGWRMKGSSCKLNDNGDSYRYYRCQGRTAQTCEMSRVANEKKIEKQLLEYVQEAVADRIAKVEAVHQERKSRPKRKSNRAAIERQLDKLEDVYISSDRMTKERYEAKKAAILAKLVEDEPEPEVPQTAGLEQIQALFDSGVLELYNGFSDEERREFWLKIVKEIWIRDGKVVGVNFVE